MGGRGSSASGGGGGSISILGGTSTPSTDRRGKEIASMASGYISGFDASASYTDVGYAVERSFMYGPGSYGWTRFISGESTANRAVLSVGGRPTGNRMLILQRNRSANRWDIKVYNPIQY